MMAALIVINLTMVAHHPTITCDELRRHVAIFGRERIIYEASIRNVPRARMEKILRSCGL